MDPIERAARDGHPYRIRPYRAEDAAGMLDLMRAVVAAGEGTVMLPADVPATVEDHATRLRASLDPGDLVRGVRLVAERDGVVIGMASIRRLDPSLVRHVALLAVEVLPLAQGIGVGRALMERAIEWATDGPGRIAPPVTRLELYVRADNVRARRMYESLGFEVEGLRRKFIRLPDGRHVDDVLMARLL
jgi:putative acetyltransferase